VAHFAKVDKNNLIVEVIVVRDEDCSYQNFPESEPIGQSFISSLGLEGQWLQTSYNAKFRGTYAGIGYTFDASLGEYGEFVAPPTVEQ
jgi:hypothetical protein